MTICVWNKMLKSCFIGIAQALAWEGSCWAHGDQKLVTVLSSSIRTCLPIGYHSGKDWMFVI